MLNRLSAYIFYLVKCLRLYNCENLMNFLFLLSIIGILSAFNIRRERVRELIIDSPITSAFREFPLILSAVMSTIAVTIPIALELILDILLMWKCGIDDRMERVFLILIVVVPGVIFLCCYKSADLPYIFCCLHAVQYVGCFGTILSLCHKLVPEHFTLSRLTLIQFFFMSASVFSMYGFGHPLFNWINITVLFQIPISLGLFFFVTFNWLKSLHLDISFSSLHKILKLSINQKTCLLYVGSTLMTIIIIPGIAAATKLLAWEFYDLPVVLIFIYSLVGFCLFPSCVPGRIARYYHSEQIKRATLQYLSHEIRSPLNVVCNGIMFVKQDLLGCNQDLMENLNDIEFASESAVSVLNDFLDFAKIESGLYKYTPALISIESFTSNMLKPLGIFARQKGLEFEIKYLFADNRLSKVGLLIDKNKMIQVFRNLIVNAVKFTPANNGKITVSVRDADNINFQEEVLPETTTISTNRKQSTFLDFILSKNSSIKKVNPMEAQSVQHDPLAMCHDPQSDIIIEVTDTGSGIPDHVHHQIFGEFFQFDPDKLQGGGGSGLGLWICKEIVQQHKGTITFSPGPNNIGTTFSVRLKTISMALTHEEDVEVNSNSIKNIHETMDCSMQPVHIQSPLSNDKNKRNNNNAPKITNTMTNRMSATTIIRPGSDDNGMSLLQDDYIGNIGTIGDHDDEDSSLCCGDPFLFDLPVSYMRRKLSILIVDDSDLNRRMMRRSVQRVVNTIDCEGGLVVQFDDADDGVSAIELVQNSLSLNNKEKEKGNEENYDDKEFRHHHKGYDVIFMDNIMLKMNGPEAAKCIRELGYTGRIVGVTGNTVSQDIEEFINFGANEVLTKPVDMGYLRLVLLPLL